jgi:hypothetical protein
VIRHAASVLFASALLGATAFAQVAEPADSQIFPGFDPGTTMRDFQSRNGPQWMVRWTHETQSPRLVFGGNLPLVPANALSDEALVAASRAFVDELAPALGYDASTLLLDRVKHLPLSRAGGTDKVVVKFQQVVSGVPTHHGWVNLLFSADGRLLGLDNQGLPHVAQAPLDATVSTAAAVAAAQAAFAADTGVPAVSVEPAGYVLFPAKADARKSAVHAAAAYQFKLAAAHDPVSGELPVIRQYVISARGEPAVLGSWSLVHGDLIGKVQGNAQAGLLPDGGAPEVLQNLKDVRLAATGETNKYTDDFGNFSFPGTNTSKLVTATFNGLYSRVDNNAGAESSVALTLVPGVSQTLLLNQSLSEQTTAEINAHISVEAMRDWVLALDPGDTSFNFQVTSNVNQASTCNAFYDGISINFYLSGGGCPNTSYSTVVWHEEGHWANDLYGSGNGGDGFGEGGADCWAMYIADNPVVAQDFFGLGTYIRTGDNTTQFCGDENPGCYGEVHFDGEPLMGAIWKVRRNLKNVLGPSGGGLLSDQYLLAWYQTFNDAQIKSIIEDHWLMLDDNDGNLNNGTPNYPTIDSAFVEQGFPGFVLPLFSVGVTPVSSPVNSEGPVTVTANVTEENGSLSAVTLFYTTNAGASFSSVPMSFITGTLWSGQIPGQNSPAVVGYYVRATDASSQGNNFPAKAPKDFLTYDVGTVTVHHSFDFEPVSDEGWTHQLVATQDDWMHGSPNGASTDPPAAYSGAQVWGNDLAPAGFNGIYQPNVNNNLQSPAFNLSGKTGLHLRFRRWLNVEKGIYDLAQVFVNNTLVFTNPADVDLLDSAWIAQDFDISSIADNNASVKVKFQLITDPGVEFGGWNIDDFQILSLGPVTGGQFVQYGAGTPGQGGVTPVLSGSGNAAPGGMITISTSSAKANAPGTLFIGNTQAAIPALGGTFLIGNILATAGITTSAGGTAVLVGTLPNTPAISGLQVNLQHWMLDPAGPKGKSATNGLQFTIQ